MDYDTWSGRTLQRPGAKGTQLWRATRREIELTLEAWTQGKPPKVTRKAYPTESEAMREIQRAVRKKLLDEFVYLDASPSPPPGTLVFAMALPGGGPADNFDLTPDGRTLFVGAGRGAPSACVLRADVTTGAVERWPVAPDPALSQLFIHGAVVDPSGQRGWFGLNSHVRAVDFADGSWESVASVRVNGHEYVNPFCVQVQRDARHARMLLANGTQLEVREVATGATLQRIPIGTSTAECRMIALSKSGEFALAYVVSRYLVGNHADARGDATHAVDVFRVSDGERVHRVPLPPPRVTAMGLSPDDATLLLRLEYANELTCIELASGASRTLAPAPHVPHDLPGWAWTPDGQLVLPKQHGSAMCCDPRTGQEHATIEHGLFPLQRVRCTPDGARLAFGGAGLFLVYTAPAPAPASR